MVKSAGLPKTTILCGSIWLLLYGGGVRTVGGHCGIGRCSGGHGDRNDSRRTHGGACGRHHIVVVVPC